jgi:hypothetical protein
MCFYQFQIKFASIVMVLSYFGGSNLNGDLVAHWKADGTAADSTGNGHDGTLFNGTHFGPGVFGQAFMFDGIDDIVVINANPDLEPSTITIAMWVKTSPSDGPHRLVADSSHGGPSGDYDGWAIQIRGNKARFAYGRGSSFPEVISNAVVADNSFHHIAATLDGATMRLYIDGTLDNTRDFSGSVSPSGRNIMFGGWHYNYPNRQLDGFVDDIRIYNHVLFPAEIEALASAAVVYADSFLVTRGQYVAGGLPEIAESDNADLLIRRATSDVQSRTEFEVKAVSPLAIPASMEVTLESAVFARSQVNQTIELYDYVTGAWEQVDTRAASRFTDSTVTVAATGDLSRFVEPGTMCMKARVRYQSPVARQLFSSNTDQFIWTIGQ